MGDRDRWVPVVDLALARSRLATSRNRELCTGRGVTGFPTLLVGRRHATLRGLGGYHANEQVREALADHCEL